MLGVDPDVIQPLWHVCRMLILKILIDNCGDDSVLSALLLNAPSCHSGPEREAPLGPAAVPSKQPDWSMRASDVARRKAQLVLNVVLAVASSC